MNAGWALAILVATAAACAIKETRVGVDQKPVAAERNNGESAGKWRDRFERDVSHKYYARGIEIIKDDEFELAERPAR